MTARMVVVTPSCQTSSVCCCPQYIVRTHPTLLLLPLQQLLYKSIAQWRWQCFKIILEPCATTAGVGSSPPGGWLCCI
jgi:hypothetical protein